ncbi:hypothetical protein HMI54_009083 [Coelomomyces lativittatus]|nr:hypothetical protein HMI54_009083 [Coelomomyces lativittatus]KAJ1502505.1 hypothetical protein HMI55_002877 [Coelomomyces lativittatus]
MLVSNVREMKVALQGVHHSDVIVPELYNIVLREFFQMKNSLRHIQWSMGTILSRDLDGGRELERRILHGHGINTNEFSLVSQTIQDIVSINMKQRNELNEMIDEVRNSILTSHEASDFNNILQVQCEVKRLNK